MSPFVCIPPGRYPYTTHLLKLQQFLPSATPVSALKVSCALLQGGSSPLCPDAWARLLTSHPDKAFGTYLTDGLTNGFRIGFNRCQPLTGVTKNMPSALRQHSVVADYIRKEVTLGRMIGPLHTNVVQFVHRNRIGVVLKGHTTGKWRLITDLSFPPGYSVNDGIDPALCSLSYVSIDSVAVVVASLGAGSLLAKIDIESAYRLVPVHPDDRLLLGIEWEGQIYCDAMLPFGLRSSAKIFTAFADALEWIVRQKGVRHIEHYLDDFVVVGAPHSSQCADSLRTLTLTCQELGVPLATEKCEGPTSCLTFLGIELDTIAWSMRLPADKLSRIKATLFEWGDKKVCCRRELESLVGLLHHACKVVKPGRSFLRRMINLLSGPFASRGHHLVRLNRDFRADLSWWVAFISEWNGVALMLRPTDEHLHFSSDAAGSWGCGASWNRHWFQVQWDAQSLPLSITIKEMLPVILAAAIWGEQWHGKQAICYCDNQAVVAVLSSRTSREANLMHMLRCLFYIEAFHDFSLRCVHVPGVTNRAADALSRNALPSFFTQVPGADPYPQPIPSRLISALLCKDGDWLSPTLGGISSILLFSGPSGIHSSDIRRRHAPFLPIL